MIFTRAAEMLERANTVQELHEFKQTALTAGDWAKRMHLGDEKVKLAISYARRAEIKLGQVLRETERNVGGDARQYPEGTGGPTLDSLGITKKESARSQFLASLPETVQQGVIQSDLTIAEVIRECKREALIKKLESSETKKTKAVQGVYDVIVIDPPWPMKMIERDVAPNQVGLTYSTMSEKQLGKLKIPCFKHCHVWLWTTARFLPMALRLLEIWNLKYVAPFVWHKPGGFQPVGLPQYNCELALYARKGSPDFIDTKDLFLCFNAPRGEHSEKPAFFYDMVRRVTAGRRLDMFNRRPITGFDTWGKQAA